MLNETSSRKYLDRGWGIKKTRVHTLWVHEYRPVALYSPWKDEEIQIWQGYYLESSKTSEVAEGKRDRLLYLTLSNPGGVYAQVYK